jgi:hypothetical protein
MLEGGCSCGAIRYQATGLPYHQTICHCSMCRRSAGAPFVGWFSVHRSSFLLIRGEPLRFRSSASAMRGFCPLCGTQLTFELDDRSLDEIDITIASLDQPSAMAPLDHTYTASKLDWVTIADGLPQFFGSRSDG